MTCFYCKGDIVPGTTVYIVQMGKTIIVIKKVLCKECEQCSEIELTHEVMIKLTASSISPSNLCKKLLLLIIEQQHKISISAELRNHLGGFPFDLRLH